jgi:fructoselysine and glucoselysine-specific PTS system IIB component
LIKLLRIDDRLIHGQVAYGWTTALGIDVILIVNDSVAEDEIRKVALNIARPANTRLYIRNVQKGIEAIEKLDMSNHNSLILVDNVQDALKIVKSCKCIKEVNVGGMRIADGKKFICDLVAVNEQDINDLKEIESTGIELEFRKLPNEKKRYLKEILRKEGD